MRHKRVKNKSKQAVKKIRLPDSIECSSDDSNSQLSFGKLIEEQNRDSINSLSNDRQHTCELLAQQSVSSFLKLIQIKEEKELGYKLTDDCFLHIFEYLTNKELCFCLRVCHRWKCLINKLISRRLRRQKIYLHQVDAPINNEKSFFLFDIFDVRQPNELRFLLNRTQYVQQLKLQVTSRKYSFRFNHLSSQKQIRYLSLEIYNDNFFLSLRQMQNRPLKQVCQQLQILRLNCQEYNWLSSRPNFLHLLATFPKLNSLQLNNLNCFNSSDTIRLGAVNKRLNAKLLTILSQPLPNEFESLVELRMPSFVLQDEFDLHLFDRMPSLQKLVIRSVNVELIYHWLITFGQRLISLKLLLVHCTNWRQYECYLSAMCLLRRARCLQINSDRLFNGPWLRRQLQLVFNCCEKLEKFRLNGFKLNSQNIQVFERFIRFVNRKGDTLTNAVNAFKTERGDHLAHLNPILQTAQLLRISSNMNLSRLRPLLPIYFTQLKQLSITFDLVILDNLLLEIMKIGFLKLEHLELRNTNHVTDQSLTKLGKHFPRLQNLIILPSRMNDFITDETWKHLLHLQNLQELNLRHLKVNPIILSEVITNLPNLFNVQLNNCPGITKIALRSLIQKKLIKNPLVTSQLQSTKQQKIQF